MRARWWRVALWQMSACLLVMPVLQTRDKIHVFRGPRVARGSRRPLRRRQTHVCQLQSAVKLRRPTYRFRPVLNIGRVSTMQHHAARCSTVQHAAASSILYATTSSSPRARYSHHTSHPSFPDAGGGDTSSTSARQVETSLLEPRRPRTHWGRDMSTLLARFVLISYENRVRRPPGGGPSRDSGTAPHRARGPKKTLRDDSVATL